MTSELRPCPFCGSPAELEVEQDHHGKFYNLGCSNSYRNGVPFDDACPVGYVYHAEDTDRVPIDKAIAAWNARAGAPAIDAGEVERLVDRLELMVYRDADKHSDETARDAHAARAALLAAVTAAKGGR